MNNRRLQPIDDHLLSYPDQQSWPEELRREVQADAELRAYWECDYRLTRLLALKQYEHPDSQAAARCRVAIRQALDESVARHRTSPALLWRALRVSAAAMLLGLLGWHLTATTRLPSIQTEPQTLRSAAPAPSIPVQAHSVAREEGANREFDAAVWSNFAPRVHQHGSFRFINDHH